MLPCTLPPCPQPAPCSLSLASYPDFPQLGSPNCLISPSRGSQPYCCVILHSFSKGSCAIPNQIVLPSTSLCLSTLPLELAAPFLVPTVTGVLSAPLNTLHVFQLGHSFPPWYLRPGISVISIFACLPRTPRTSPVMPPNLPSWLGLSQMGLGG